MTLFKYLLFSLLALVTVSPIVAQDTTTVQCFDFDDITKRRGTYNFPSATEEFSKILMVYTLKCDSRTTRDQYDCGEWDYLTYTKLYHHDGTIDSTYKTHPSFKVGNTSPGSYAYKATPSFDLTLDKQFSIRHTATQSLTLDTIGSGTSTNSSALKTSELSGRSQYLWKSNELAGVGMTSGAISGIQLDIKTLGSVLSNFEIRMGHSTQDSLTGDFVSNLTTVYRHEMQFTTVGFNDIQFTNNFTWNGTDNIVVEFLFDNKSQGIDFELNSTPTSYSSGLEQAGTEYFMELNGSQQYVNLGNSFIIDGNKPRTIEFWSRVDLFNSGGLFQAGKATNGADFSLRTLGNDNQFRMQQFGTPDFDFTYPGVKGGWHHYAAVRAGNNTLVYIDGNLAGSEASGISTQINDMYLGRWQGRYLTGAIKEFRVWDKDILLSEMKAWMNRSVTPSHPSYSNLVAYYNINEPSGDKVLDKSANAQPDGNVLNSPIRKRLLAEDLLLNTETTTLRPNIVFEQGVYTSVLDSVDVYDTINRAPVTLYEYNNAAGGKKIDDNDPNHPTIATKTSLVWQANVNWFIFDTKTGGVLFTNNVAADVNLTQETKEWYSPEVVFELARFITPYGIRLDLGPDGFTWFYDVTDYRHLLTDSVDISAGNQQELIDLKFVMIKGKPARPVVAMNRVWGTYRSIRYSALSDNTALAPKKVKEHPDAEYMMLKTRLTGHGHNSNDGSYPHCCEWTDNTHYMNANGQRAAEWHIWQTNECAENPVYPQGGTWPGAREGWCPGDVVKETDIELTDFMGRDSIEIDYDITPVPTSNLGMGNGNYIVGMHLFQYGPAAYKNDVEVYDVLNPTSKRIHSRRSTTCSNPSVIIRNGGSSTLTSAEIKYRVAGGKINKIKWTGNLKFMETEEVELPVSEECFYTGDGSNAFEVNVGLPNKLDDENPLNNEYRTTFNIPDKYPGKMIVNIATNNRANENEISIKDINGKVVYSKSSLSNNTNTRDTIDLADGCYSFELSDAGNDGLSYWANSAQGNGSMVLFSLNESGNIGDVKSFNPDFGGKLNYSFTIGFELDDFLECDDTSKVQWEYDAVSTSEQEVEWKTFKVFPNPASNEIALEMLGQEGVFNVEIVNVSGQVVLTKTVSTPGYTFELIDISNLTDGLYVIRMSTEEDIYMSKFMKE